MYAGAANSRLNKAARRLRARTVSVTVMPKKPGKGRMADCTYVDGDLGNKKGPGTGLGFGPGGVLAQDSQGYQT